MEDNEKHLTVIIPLEKYEALIRDSERLASLSTAVWNALEKHEWGVSVSDKLVTAYAAICPEDFDAFMAKPGEDEG